MSACWYFWVQAPYASDEVEVNIVGLGMQLMTILIIEYKNNEIK